MAGPGEDLFDFMAERLRGFLADHGFLGDVRERRGPIPLGFTFSFPTRQRSLAVAELTQWTKG